MRNLLKLAVHVASVAAVWLAWGWGAAIIVALVSLVVLSSAKSRWGLLRYINPLAWLRLLAEIAVFIAGLIAANAVWGTIWAAALFVAYVIRFIARP